MPMRHSIDELLERVYQLYPRGIWHRDPQYDVSEEQRRLVAARRQAGEDDAPWRAMLRRLDARLPDCSTEDRSYHLRGGGCDACYSARLDLPASSYGPKDCGRELGFLVSFVVPYYVIYSARSFYLEPGAEALSRRQEQRSPEEERARWAIAEELDRRFGSSSTFPTDQPVHHVIYVDPPPGSPKPKNEEPVMDREIRFELSPDEEPYARVIAEEIEATFAGHEPMPAEVGKIMVPDVVAGRGWMGDNSLYDCLFSHDL